jgi:peptidoglycan/LPS O-acetylase OafA/YrhL
MNSYTLTSTSSKFIHALRAVLAQLVLVGHVVKIYGFTNENSLLTKLTPYAVLVFFVLSGYVIAYSTGNKDKEYGFKKFMIARFARIYIVVIPTLVFSIVLGFIGYAMLGFLPYNLNPWHIVSTLLMQQENPVLLHAQYILPNNEYFNIIGFFGENLPLWSLSLEWWNYVFFGFVFYFSVSKYSKFEYLLFIASLMFVISYTILPSKSSYGLTLIWFEGVLIHQLLNKKIQLNYSGTLAMVSLLLTCFVFNLQPQLSITPCGLFLFFSIRFFQKNSSNTWNIFLDLFKWPGNYSFSLYCLHYPLLLLSAQWLSPNPWNVLLIIVLSNTLSYLNFQFIESKHKALGKLLLSKIQPHRHPR